MKTSNTEQQIVAWENLNMQKIAEMKEDSPKIHARLEAAISAKRNELQITPAGEV